MQNVLLTAGIDIATDRIEIEWAVHGWARANAHLISTGAVFSSFQVNGFSIEPWAEGVLRALDGPGDRLVWKPSSCGFTEIAFNWPRRIGKTWARERFEARQNLAPKARKSTTLRGRLMTSSAVLAGA